MNSSLKKYLQYSNLDHNLLKDIQDAIAELQSLSSKVIELHAQYAFEKGLSDFFAKTVIESNILPDTHPVVMLYNKARKEQQLNHFNN